MGFEGDVRESGREASAAFPSQQVLVFGPGETASIGPVGWSSGLEACAAFPSQQVLVFGPVRDRLRKSLGAGVSQPEDPWEVRERLLHRLVLGVPKAT